MGVHKVSINRTCKYHWSNCLRLDLRQSLSIQVRKRSCKKPTLDLQLVVDDSRSWVIICLPYGRSMGFHGLLLPFWVLYQLICLFDIRYIGGLDRSGSIDECIWFIATRPRDCHLCRPTILRYV
jgi:hypothetical protein